MYEERGYQDVIFSHENFEKLLQPVLQCCKLNGQFANQRKYFLLSHVFSPEKLILNSLFVFIAVLSTIIGHGINSFGAFGRFGYTCCVMPMGGDLKSEVYGDGC
jgi:hypothetical protein